MIGSHCALCSYVRFSRVHRFLVVKNSSRKTINFFILAIPLSLLPVSDLFFFLSSASADVAIRRVFRARARKRKRVEIRTYTKSAGPIRTRGDEVTRKRGQAARTRDRGKIKKGPGEDRGGSFSKRLLGTLCDRGGYMLSKRLRRHQRRNQRCQKFEPATTARRRR